MPRIGGFAEALVPGWCQALKRVPGLRAGRLTTAGRFQPRRAHPVRSFIRQPGDGEGVLLMARMVAVGALDL